MVSSFVWVRIENIENYPGNEFTVFNRWGDKVFEMENHDNDRNVFTGVANVRRESELVTGTTFMCWIFQGGIRNPVS